MHSGASSGSMAPTTSSADAYTCTKPSSSRIISTTSLPPMCGSRSGSTGRLGRPSASRWVKVGQTLLERPLLLQLNRHVTHHVRQFRISYPKGREERVGVDDDQSVREHRMDDPPERVLLPQEPLELSKQFGERFRPVEPALLMVGMELFRPVFPVVTPDVGRESTRIRNAPRDELLHAGRCLVIEAAVLGRLDARVASVSSPGQSRADCAPHHARLESCRVRGHRLGLGHSRVG